MKMKNKQLLTLLSLTMFSTLNFAQGIVTPQLVTVDQYQNNNSRSFTGSNTSTTYTSSANQSQVITSTNSASVTNIQNSNIAIISDTLPNDVCVSGATWNTYMDTIKSNAAFWHAAKNYAEQFSREASSYQQLLTQNNIPLQWPAGSTGGIPSDSLNPIDVGPLNNTFKTSSCPSGQFSGASVNEAVKLANTYRTQGNTYRILQTQWDAQAKAFQQQAQKANLQLAAPTFTEGPKAGEDLGYYLNRWSNSQQPN